MIQSHCFHSRFVQTDVTSVKILKGFYLVGCGGHLCIFDLAKIKLINRKEIFCGIKIHGIEINSAANHLLIYGRDLLRIYEWNVLADQTKLIHLEENASASNGNWILCAKWVEEDQKVATITSDNKVYLWSLNLKVVMQVLCIEKCILYSGSLVYKNWSDLIALSGTVFSEVLIWKTATDSIDHTCSVLRRLRGHKGVIFSIHYNMNSHFICSTSDDRSAILWNIGKELSDEVLQPKSSIEQHCKVYGHVSRIFRCKVLLNHFITGGEDGLVNIWNFDGSLYKKIETQQGSQVWGLEVDEIENILIASGGDGGVGVFPYEVNLLQKTLYIPENEVPKRVIILSNNDIITVTDKGCLFLYNPSSETWLRLHIFEDLQSYVLLEVSKCRNEISLSGFCGQIYIYKLHHDGDFKQICSTVLKDEDRIFAFHWLTCNLFLVCQSRGNLTLCEIKNSEIVYLCSFLLPPSKERWTTTACRGPNGSIIVGDRRGSIHVFKIGYKTAIQSLWKAHSHLGVTSVYFSNNKLTSLGRNSVIKEFIFNNQDQYFDFCTADKTPITWLASKHDDVIAAFCGNSFVLWDSKNRRNLWEYDCRGGHRSYDFKKRKDEFSFVFLKDKNVYELSGNLSNIVPVNVIQGFHIREINALDVVNLSNSIVIISGGEDTTLRISNIQRHTEITLQTVNIQKSHLSSIRSIVVHQLNENKYLLFSAGGRAQLILWLLDIPYEGDPTRDLYCAEHDVFHEALEHEESEMRIMDLLCTLINSELKLFAVCSDGNIKIFTVLSGQKGMYSLRFDQNIFYKLKCILRVNIIEFNGLHILITTATDGLVSFWNIKSTGIAYGCELLSSIAIHQSGINSCQYILQGKLCHILTGGDDNAVVLTTIYLNQKNDVVHIECVTDWKDTGAHCTQINGVFICDKYFVTLGIDQRLAVFEWKYHEKQLNCKLVNIYKSTITDVQGMRCFLDNECLNILIHGRGLEYLQIPNNVYNV